MGEWREGDPGVAIRGVLNLCNWAVRESLGVDRARRRVPGEEKS